MKKKKTTSISKAKRAKITWLVDVSSGKAGSEMMAYKDERGWHGVDEEGTTWALFESHLKIPEVCKVEILE